MLTKLSLTNFKSWREIRDMRPGADYGALRYK